MSNYFNVARAALLEKGVAFDWVPARATQEPDFLALNPMGKIPVLETKLGCIAETVAMLEYLEEAYPDTPLYPADAYERARARQLINIAQVYVEVPLRSLFPGVFMGGVNDPATIAAARPSVERAMRAIGQMASLRPFLLGDTLSHADLFLFYTLDLADRVTRFVYDWSLRDSIAGLTAWDAMIRARPSSQTVLADFAPAFATYLNDKKAAWREPAAKEHDHA